MAVTVESTTAPQWELDHAVSPERKDPAAADKFRLEEEKNQSGAAEEVVDAAKAGSETEAEHPSGTEEGKRESEKKAKVKFSPEQQAELNRIVAKEKADARKKARTELEAERTNAAPPEKKTEAAKPSTERPTRANFLAQGKTDEEYEDALFAWRKGEDTRQAESADIEERTKEIVTTYNERMAEAKEKYDDFDQKLKDTTIPWKAENPQDVQASKAFQIAIRECENGPEVLYHIATHPEVAESFGSLSPVKTQLLIGRLSASLLPSETPTKRDPPKTKVAAPPKVVGGSAHTSGFDPYKDAPKDHKQYMAWRKAQGGRAN